MMVYRLGQIMPVLPVIGSIEREAAQGYEYIKSKVAEFRRLDGKLYKIHHRAASIAGRAQAEGRADEHERASALVDRIGALRVEYGNTVDKLDAIKAAVPGLGFVPVIPIAIAGVVIAVALAIRSIFRKATAEERALELLEEGILTPAEIAEVRGAGGMFGGLGITAKYVALAVGLYFGLPMLAKVVRR